jgi:hypothetical protein
MTISAATKRSLKDEILELALKGTRPRDIADKFEARCDYNYVANLIAQARRGGMAIPVFGSGGRRTGAEINDAKVAAREMPVQPPAALDYFELRALKKLLGDDLKEIEADADLEGLSIAAYVREVMLDHARKIRE